MINQKEIVERLKSFVDAKNIPHCIFAGPPGTGKTTAALCLAHALYGDGYREHLMELRKHENEQNVINWLDREIIYLDKVIEREKREEERRGY